MPEPRVATVSVRVVPRSARRGLETGPRGILVRVRAAPEGGRATEEAGRVLAEVLGVPPSAVSLRSGRTSRTKVFAVAGLSTAELAGRLPGA